MEPDKLFQTMYDNPRKKTHLQKKKKGILKYKLKELHILPPFWVFILYQN